MSQTTTTPLQTMGPRQTQLNSSSFKSDDIAKVEGMMPVQGKQRYGDRDWAAFGGYILGSYLEALNTNATVMCQTDHIFADNEHKVNPTLFKSLQMAHA